MHDATQADATAISAFMIAQFRATFEAHNTAADMATYLAEAFTLERQAQEIADPLGPYLMLEIDGALAGVARVRLGSRDAQVSGEPQAEIQRFYVDAVWHGRGVAQRLMTECMARADRSGAATVWLGVWEQNVRAIRFYEKCGFTDVGTATFVLGEDVQRDRVMARAITRPRYG